MLRKVKPTRRFLTTMILIILMSVSFLVSTQSPSIAQGTDCPGNLVANGNFQSGLVAGPLGGGGAVSNWTLAYRSPDVSVSGHDPGSVAMWGNQTVGEGLQQNLGGGGLVSGKTYLVSLWVKWDYDPNKQNYAKFKVRASTNPLTSPQGGNTIGLTGHINGPAWQPVSFTWTAPANGPFRFLTISVENDFSIANGSYTSYGSVDDICIQEVPSTGCCRDVRLITDLQSLVDKGNGAYDFTATLSTNQSNIIRVTADLISSSLTYSAPGCGTAGPVDGYVVGATNVGNLIAWVPVTNGQEVF